MVRGRNQNKNWNQVLMTTYQSLGVNQGQNANLEARNA